MLRAKARGTEGVSAHAGTRLPREHGAFWGWLQDQDVPTLLSLMAVCVARVTNAWPRAWITPEGSQCIAAQVATAAGLDMRTCCTATKDSYLAQVPRALIVEAVREGAGARAAEQIVGGKKEVMVADVNQLLVGTGWLPSILRVLGASDPVDSGDTDSLTTPEMRSLPNNSSLVSLFLPWAVSHGAT